MRTLPSHLPVANPEKVGRAYGGGRGAAPPPPKTGKESPLVDLTGYWEALVTRDWLAVFDQHAVRETRGCDRLEPDAVHG
jgi:hypothetical protein